jgi:uncharacterized protein
MRLMIAAMIVLIGLGGAGSARADYKAGSLAYNSGDYKTALRELEPLAKEGDAHSQSMLGIMYSEGRGVKKNLTEAFNWYYKAALAGEGGAQLNLGNMFHTGKGVNQDYREAAKWYKRAEKNSYDMGIFMCSNSDLI